MFVFNIYWTQDAFTVCLFFGGQMSLSMDSLYNAIVYELSEVFHEMQVLHTM
jgi:hypothetical protein